ncbi:MAG: hypothetical protein CMO55_20070 [Verrucomicrobiales bacterium]|nr:hypothetical protein [Verrucomicrobiales bacterium]
MRKLCSSLLAAVVCFAVAEGEELPRVEEAKLQPVRVNLSRLVQAMNYIGWPFPGGVEEGAFRDLKGIQDTFDPLCLAVVTINPESRVSVDAGLPSAAIVQNEWTCFLIKVINEAGVTAPLRISTEETSVWVDTYGDRPVNPRLSGIPLEYRIAMVRTSELGKVSAVLTFDVGQGTQDVGFRSDLLVTFDAKETFPVYLRPLDEDGQPTTAAFEFRDEEGQVWPPQVKRIEPDFRFHPQVYRAFGQSVSLPEGKYEVTVTRGPEYFPKTVELKVDEQQSVLDVSLKRWIDPSDFGWWSGDHHIHAAGCKHYESPSEGVHADAMYRHVVGEDLKVGANLTWGPCFDYQKQFFTGKVDNVSRYPYLIRYDVEVSGFGSHRSGHLCLLRLKEQIIPGGDSKEHWPTLCLNTLKWAQKQGAVCGPAHSGWGLMLPTDDLPNYNIPPYDGIGANEYIVDVTHMVEGPEGEPVPAVDFLSMVDTPHVWELNIWYHTLNCGYRTRISGETDFPCIYGERVGLGRSYIKLDGKLDYDAWCEGISKGRGYVSDGNSHLIDMSVNGVGLGTAGSEVKISPGETISISAKVAARLTGDRGYAKLGVAEKPFWHIERARIGDSEKVPLELVVNGEVVAKKEIQADGSLSDVSFDDVSLDNSSWVALRILPSSHTNPVFVLVDEKPIRASRKSARWCLDSVEQCWSQKEKLIDAGEMEDAIAAYEHARRAYSTILKESAVD